MLCECAHGREFLAAIAARAPIQFFVVSRTVEVLVEIFETTEFSITEIAFVGVTCRRTYGMMIAHTVKR